MHKLLLAVITVTVMAVSDCGGEDVKCSDTGKCPQDTAPSAPYVAACQATLAATCGSQWQAILNCVKSKEVCDSSGTLDLTATKSVCSTEFGNFATCCATNPTAAGCQ